jgi:hypothetical protein
MTITRRRDAAPPGPERVLLDGRPAGSCVCDDRGGTCGWHYSQLDDRERALIRARRGIRFGRGTVAGAERRHG